MITQAKFDQMYNAFKGPIARATYELDGVETDTDYTISTQAGGLRLVIILDNAVVGRVGAFKLWDSDGTLACSTSLSFYKAAGKKHYLAWQINIKEVAL